MSPLQIERGFYKSESSPSSKAFLEEVKVSEEMVVNLIKLCNAGVEAVRGQWTGEEVAVGSLRSITLQTQVNVGPPV